MKEEVPDVSGLILVAGRDEKLCERVLVTVLQKCEPWETWPAARTSLL